MIELTTMRVSVTIASTGDQYVSAPSQNFDYAALPPSVGKFLRGQADRIRRQCASSIIQIGRALIEAKRYVSHGAFLRWVEGEVGIPSRTAQAYMRVATWASGKGATVAHLPPSALYMLSSREVPESFVIEILDRVEAGEHITPSAIREELKAVQLSRRTELFAEEISAYRSSWGDIERGVSPVGDGMAGSAIAEFVALLVQRLSVMDFARMCEILTNDRVLTDPHLAEKLRRQLRSAAENCMMSA